MEAGNWEAAAVAADEGAFARHHGDRLRRRRPEPTAHEHGPGGHHHHGPGHNHSHDGALHSHMGGGESRQRAELQALAETFIAGFRAAEDKPSWLRLAGIPLSCPGPDGLKRHLVDVKIDEGYQLATASPGFGSRELVYLPFPGTMVRGRTTLTFVYVSLTGRTDLDLVEHLAGRFADGAS